VTYSSRIICDLLRQMRLLSLITVLPLAISGYAIAQEGEIVVFETPSGNISCVYGGPDSNSPESSITCEIYKFTSSFDQEFARDRWLGCEYPNDTCTPDKINRFTVSDSSQKGEAGCPCLDITTCIDYPDVCKSITTIDYGASFRRGGLSCSSEKDGMTCRNALGHGFFLSKAKQSIF
jgi:hypothetical protein